jgi:catechol O-methyltransferase
MADLIGRLPANARILELGAYCGYSAIMIADQLGPEGRLTSIEVDSDSVRASRANVAYAGYADKVEILEGSSSEIIQTLDGTFDLVFLDHWKDLYEKDIRLIEKRGLLRAGTTVVADNVGEMFGADAYLEYVRGCGRYDSENRPAHVEYSDLPDAVEISIYKGPN